MNHSLRLLVPCFALLAAPQPARAATVELAGPLALSAPGWVPLVLFVAGLILLAAEVFVLPGFGVAGVLGTAAVLAGLVLGVLGPAPTRGDLFVAGWVVLGAVTTLGLATRLLLERLPREGKLRASARRDQGYVSSTRREELVGVEGVAVTDLRPSGTARFGEERVDVVSEGSFVPAGTAVRVVRADGYRHVVRAVG